MEGLYKEGRIRAIGVSNFGSDRIIDFCNNADVIPAVNQMELHPFYQRDDELLKEYGIAPQAWATFAEGLNGMFSNPILREIAKAHNRTIAQVILCRNMQRGVSIVPKSVHKDRMKENFTIWVFTLTTQEMQQIATLDLGRPQMLDPLKPSEVRRVYNYLKNPVRTSL